MDLVKHEGAPGLTLLLAAGAAGGLGTVGFAWAWTAILPPIFGSPLLSHLGIVLAMAINLLAGIIYAEWRSGRRGVEPVTVGMLLVGAAASGFVALLLVQRSESFYAAVTGGYHGALASSVAGFVLVLAVVFVPCFLLGAALDLGARLYERSTGSPTAASRFLTMVALGVAAGAALLGLLAMPHLGARATAGSVALLVAAVGAASAFKRASDAGDAGEAGQAQPPAAGEGGKDELAEGPEGWPVVTVAVYCVCVFASVACAIIWTRFLAQVVGKTVYLSAVMLTVFAAGIALGSLASDPLARRTKGPLFWLGASSALTGVIWLVPFLFVNRLPFVFLRFFSLGPRLNSPDWGGVVLAYFALCFAIMLLPGLLAGSTLPFALKSANPERRLQAGSFALVAAAVLIGILAAALVSLAVPRSGLTTRRVLTALPWLSVLAGCFYMLNAKRPFLTKMILAAVMIVASAALGLLPPAWNQGIATGGLYTNPQRFSNFKHLEAALQTADVAFYEEDRDQAVSVLRTPDGVYMRENGAPVQSTAEDLTTQVLAAHLPMVVRGGAARAMIIGVGTGITLASVLTYDISAVECVEPVLARVRACQVFTPYNRGALRDARVRIVACDPLNYMLLGHDAYDVIICQDPSRAPGLARLARGRLGSEGVLAEVISFDKVSLRGFKAIASELCTYFPNVDLWWGGGTELVLVASLKPMSVPLIGLEDQTGRKAAARDLKRIGITGGISLLSCYMMGRESLLRAAPGEGNNTDVKSTLTYGTLAGSGSTAYLRTLIDLDAASENPITRMADAGEQRTELSAAAKALSNGALARRNYFQSLVAAGNMKFGEAQGYLDSAKNLCPESGIFRSRLSDFYVALSGAKAEANQFQDAISAARRAVEEDPASFRAFYYLANLEAKRDPETAVGLLKKALDLNPDYVPAYLLETETELGLGAVDLASETVAKVLAIEPLNVRAHHLRALCLIQREMPEDARKDLDFVIRAEPDNADAMAAIAYTWLQQNDLTKGQRFYQRALSKDPDNLEALNNLGTILAEKGNYARAISIWERALELDPGNADLKKNIESARAKK